jgi:hypothetical protein
LRNSSSASSGLIAGSVTAAGFASTAGIFAVCAVVVLCRPRSLEWVLIWSLVIFEFLVAVAPVLVQD